MIEQLAWIAAGLALLAFGADWLVKGASRLAVALRVAPLLIGMTVVAFANGAPEMAVSVTAARTGAADLAVANVIGSNLFNILFILGACALVTPLLLRQSLVRKDVPVMIGVTLVLFLFTRDGVLGAGDGLLLCALAVGATVFLLLGGRAETSATIRAEYAEGTGDAMGDERGTPVTDVAFILAGVALLVVGADFAVSGAAELARLSGAGEVLVGLTLLAIGSALPELATSLVAAGKGQHDLAIGNLIGSCIFNVCAVLGVSALLAPEMLAVAPALQRIDAALLLGATLLCLPLLRVDFRLDRWRGGLLVAGYLAYLLFLTWRLQGA